MREIVFVTSNPNKVESAQKHFRDSDLVLKYYEIKLIEPNVDDIEAIVRSKVLQGYEIVNKPCMAVDSGFYIPSYPNKPNFPGAFPRREIIEGIGIEGLLENMKNVKNRECYFKDCLAYYNGIDIYLFFGVTHGVLSKEIKGNYIKSWSELWKVFIPLNCDKALAEMSEEELKNRPDGHTDCFKEFKEFIKKLERK